MVNPGPTDPSAGSRSSGGSPTRGADVVGGTPMLTALVRLHSALQEARLPLELAGVEAHREDHLELVSQLEDYLIPRVTTMEGPLLAVVGGSTGAGKSTLVNTLVGRRVTEAGVLRPTTRSPVLVHHPDDAGWFGQGRLLPELSRVDAPTTDPGALQLVASEAVPAGLAVLDAPDVDSVDESNRLLAAELLAAADLWLFVTSAARYADQVPWEFLRQAAERSTSVAIVLDRTAAADAGTVATHLARMLASRGLKDVPLFTVPESTVDEEGLLPAGSVDDVREWLEALAADTEARAALAARTVGGTIRTLGGRAHALAGSVAQQIEVVDELARSARDAYAPAVGTALEATYDQTVLRGDVLARWQELVGDGELVRSLEERVTWVRDRVVNAVRGRPQSADRVVEAVASALRSLLVEQAEAAADRAATTWGQSDPGRRLLADSPDDLARATPDAAGRAERLVHEWQDGLLRMVRAEGSDKRSTTRYLTYGVNGLATALMIDVLDRDRTTSAPRLLEAVFGEQAVRSLSSRARGDLDRRVEAFFAGEGARHVELVLRVGPDPSVPEQLREAARRVDDLRFRAAQPTQPGTDRTSHQVGGQ